MKKAASRLSLLVLVECADGTGSGDKTIERNESGKLVK